MLKNSKETSNPTNNEQNFCWNFLKNFDIFGITFNFRMEADEKFQSTTGGLWLIGFILLTIFLMVNTVISYLQNPVFNSFYTEDPLNFTNPHDHIKPYEEKFNFGLILILEPGIFPNDTFIIKGYYAESHEKTNYTIKKTELNQIDCNDSMFISDTNKANEFSKSFISLATCFDLSNYTMKGSYFDDDYSYFTSEVQINKNLNLTYIEELIYKYPPEYQIIYPDIVVNSNDYSTFDTSPNNLYDEIERGIRKVIDFYVVRYHFEQDLGIIFSNKQSFFYTKYERSTYRTRKMERNSKGNPAYSTVNIRGLAYIKKNKKYITKLITVCQLQLTNLLNYLVLFKIFATTINFKNAKKHLTKNFYVVDKNLNNELRQHLKDDWNKKNLISDKGNNFKNIQDSDKNDSINIVNKDDILVNSIKMKEKYKKYDINKFSLKKNLSSNYNEKKNPILSKNIITGNEEIINDKTKTITVDKNLSKNENKYNSNLDITTNRILLNIKVDNKNINFPEIKNNLNKNDNSFFYNQNDHEKIKKIVSNTKENLEIPDDAEKKFKIYDKILDLTYFKKKMDEIELLKYLLFDKKSIFFFNFLAGKINPFDSIINPYNFEDFENRNSLIKNYDIKTNNNKNNFVERKIIKLLEKFVKNN